MIKLVNFMVQNLGLPVDNKLNRLIHNNEELLTKK